MDAPHRLSLSALVYDTFIHDQWSFFRHLQIETNNKGVDMNDLLKWAFGENYKALHEVSLKHEWKELHPALAKMPYTQNKIAPFLVEQYKQFCGD